MLRRLYPGPVPDASWRHHFRRPDPDCLIGLAARFARGADDRQTLSLEFSQVVSSIRVGRTHKLTRPNRLDVSTRALCERLSCAKGELLEFLDVGASDGITTLEAARMFERQWHVTVRGCLIDPFIRLIRYRAGSIVEYRTPDQSPVMVCLGSISLELSSLDTSRDVLSRGLGYWYLSRTAFRQAMPVDTTVSLVNPLVAADPTLSVIEWDVLRHNPALADRFRVVRASNVLNLSYFSPSQVETALSHLHAYLRQGGLMLISRSHLSGDGEVDHGAIWRKHADRFIQEHSIGSGAEIAELVNQYRERAA